MMENAGFVFAGWIGTYGLLVLYAAHLVRRARRVRSP